MKLEMLLTCLRYVQNEKLILKIVGHLPREISRITKFLLDRGAVIYVEIITSNYRRSPLVQGGLEIQCKVVVEMHPTVKNNQILERYLSLFDNMYTEPDNEVIVGSFLNEASPHVPQVKRTYHASRNVRTKKISYDIRTLFAQQTSTHEKKDVIEID